MAKLKKQNVLFIILAVVVFLLIFPASTGLSRCPGRIDRPADDPVDTGRTIGVGGCATSATVTYSTSCETFVVGGCSDQCCEKDCDEYDCWCSNECQKCSAGAKWTEYKCDSPTCGATIQKRECESYVDRHCRMGNCVDDQVCVECGEWTTCEICESWQIPRRAFGYFDGYCEPCNQISVVRPLCMCGPSCLIPKNPRYYNHILHPINECNIKTDYQMDSDNVFLPVKIDWDNIRGHVEGWGTNQPCRQVLECPRGNMACHYAPTDPDFRSANASLEQCKRECKTGCYYPTIPAMASGEDWRLAPYQIPPTHTDCVQECENDCREQNEHKTSADGCSGRMCPLIPDKDGGIEEDSCYSWPYGYAHSYEIIISGKGEEGAIRDCSALKKIDELEQLIEEEKMQESADWRKIERWEQEIINIRKGTHPIYQLEKNSYTTFLEKSEFLPPCSCMLKSGRTYNLDVRACCPPKDMLEKMTESKRNSVCGEWKRLEFITNRAPEPKLPYDPDWTGPEKTESLSREQSREVHWCEIDSPDYYRETIIMLPPHGDIEYIYSPLSYLLQFYYFDDDKNKLCHHFLDIEKDECDPEIFSPSFHEKIPPNKFSEEGFFTKETHYVWRVAACRERGGGGGRTDYGQLWEFSTREWDLDIVLPHPPDNPDRPIGLPITLSWSGADANSFKYKLYEEGTLIKKDWVGTSSLPLDYNDPLKLDTVYSWEIQPCWDTEAEKCEDDVWFGPWQFRTTGRPPELYNPTEDDIVIPTNFKWESVPGARSYIFKVGEIEIITDKLEREIGYPDLKLDTTYSWEVFTCADTAAEICHNQPATTTFTTFDLKEPSDPTPAPGSKIHTRKVSWKEIEGARFYQYQISFLALHEEEKRKDCEDLEPNSIIIEGGTSKPPTNLPLKCWGEYEWRVRACLDNTCGEGGRTDYSDDWWSFEFIAEFLPEDVSPGLIPCNQDFYNPDTPWDETDPCGIEHLFIIIHILVNFLLVRILPMILVLLALASGIIFYFSIKMEAPNPAAKVKSLWRAAGIGIGLLLFAWIITSLLLNLFGYQLGPWHILG